VTRFLLPLCGALLLCSPCPARVVLNEVLYDPTGADGGAEFVELFNGGTAPVDLDGWRLDFANGAVGPDWATRWRGAAGETVAPGARYLIADRGWTGPAADAVVSLSLQNGPDAVRLVAADGTVDRLGYGTLTQAELYEGAPHPGATGGRALARRPDGADSDHNDIDWTPAVPTPGAPNFPRHAAACDGIACDPPSCEVPGEPVAVRVSVLNLGLEALPAGPVRLDADVASAADAETEALSPFAGATLDFSWRPAGVGDFDLWLEWPLPEGGLRLPVGRYHVGGSALLITEVAAAPAPGGSEWIELAATETGALQLADFALADEGGAPRGLPAYVLAPGERVVVAQDRAALLAERRRLALAGAPGECAAVDPAPFVLELSGGWPVLNNTPAAGAPFAERLRLIAADGLVVDHVAIGCEGVEILVGRSVERTTLAPGSSAPWGVCTDPSGGTPACGNSLERSVSPGGPLALEPNPWDPQAQGGLAIGFELPPAAAGWRLEVFDAWGHRRRDLGGDRLGPGPRHRVWDGRDDDGGPLGAGAHVVVLTLQDAAGGVLQRWRTLLAVTAGGCP
jgi:hypothetical protein